MGKVSLERPFRNEDGLFPRTARQMDGASGGCAHVEVQTLTWDTDEDGDWAEHVKGVDDYLHGLEQKK